jgi:aminoglycoside phosphotransferase (APT) family kinase protein
MLGRDECFSRHFSVRAFGLRNQLYLISTERRTIAHKTFSSADVADQECGMLLRLEGAQCLRVPRLIDRDDRVVVTETPPALVTLREDTVKRRAGIGTQVATQLADTLAHLHGRPIKDLAPTQTLPFDPNHAAADVLDESWVVRDNLRLMQDSALNESVAELRHAAVASRPVPVHGDIRSDNILLKDRRGPLTLIDWEFSGQGYRWMDVGSALAMIVEVAIVVGKGAPNPSIVRRLLSRYARKCAVPLDLRSTIQCAGIKLLQTSAEVAAASSEHDSRVDRLRQAGTLFLSRPYEAGVHVGALW